jgi:hypothetical protein
VKIGFPNYLSLQSRYNYKRTTALFTGFYFYPKTGLNLCAQVIDWCFCARVFSCSFGNACLALFRKDGFVVTRCRLRKAQ